MIFDNLIVRKIKGKAVGLIYFIEDKWAISHLKRDTSLWSVLEHYLKKSESTGCSYPDYWALYDYVRTQKPTEILECGPGVTTLIMAHALMENEKETGICGRITAMEEIEYWHQMVETLLPDSLKKYVDLVLSPRVEDFYSIFRGVRYRDVPNRPYDFVFIDGPDYKSPSDGAMTFDFDFIRILQQSHQPVSAMIDKRVSTCYVFQKLLGTKMVRYNARKGLGFVAPCTKKDLRTIDAVTPSLAFADSIRMFGKNELKLTLK